MDDDKTRIAKVNPDATTIRPNRSSVDVSESTAAQSNEAETDTSHIREPDVIDPDRTVIAKKAEALPTADRTVLKKPSADADKTVLATGKKTLPPADETLLYQPEDGTTGLDDKTTLKVNPAIAVKEDRIVCVGDTLKDRFVLDKLLGSGGMGSVYRALDLRKQEAHDDRPYIAIKVLGENFKNHPQALITLQREAKKTQDLAHPNIVTVYDFDRDGDLVYLTMEELKGSSLEDLIAEEKYLPTLDNKKKLQIIRQIAQGLSYAHKKGIVHSDLKPGNVFITDSGTVKLLDFGIARAANETIYQDSFDAGELGAITFTYASPEMIRHEPPHPSDDIYALGIIACELLTGAHPFGRKNAQQALEERLTPKLPKIKNPFLRKLIEKSIKLNRKDRIADAGVFVKHLNSAAQTPTRIAMFAVAACIALIGNYFYIQTIEVELIPFSDLPVEAQASFHELIQESKTALSFGDMQGAVFNIDRAYQIHATNDDIKALTEKVTTIMQENIRSAETDETRAFYQQQLNELKQYPAFSAAEI